MRAEVLLLLSLAVSTPVPAGADREQEVKAALIFNFLKFCTWPEPLRSPSELRACTLSSPSLAGSLGELSGRQIQGRTLTVHELDSVDRSPECDAVFLGEEGPVPELLAAAVEGQGVLTLAHGKDYAQRGVAINFYIEDDQLRFEASPSALEASGVELSSQVLRLARIVKPARRNK